MANVRALQRLAKTRQPRQLAKPPLVALGPGRKTLDAMDVQKTTSSIRCGVDATMMDSKLGVSHGKR